VNRADTLGRRMAANRSTDDQLVALRAALVPDAGSASARAALLAALASKHNLLVAAAAEAVADHELEGFDAALAGAYDRFLDNAVKRDALCRAKTAAVRALHHTSSGATTVFLRGIRYVQLEPVWGGSQDTAVELRGLCAFGLVRNDYPDVLIELADLLADAEPMARVAAARAIAYSERREGGVPLLRFKVQTGDSDVRVTSACIAGLLALAPEHSLPFVAELARRPNPELREAALLALGESRRPEALPLLTELAEHAVTEADAGVVLLAVALLRSDAAWGHLLDLIREGSTTHARAAIDALATYRDDSALRARTLAAVEARDDARLLAHAREAMQPKR